MSHRSGSQEKIWPRDTDLVPSMSLSDTSWGKECRMRRQRAKNGANHSDGGRGNHQGGKELGKYFVISAKRIGNAQRGQVRKVLTIIHMH